MEYQVYNTGDQVWTSMRNGQRVTVKVITHDGLMWEEGEQETQKLKGFEKYLHKVQMFLTKQILRFVA